MKICQCGIPCRADAGRIEAAGFGRLQTGLRILYHKRMNRFHLQQLRRQKKNLRAGLGMRDLRAVGHSVKKRIQTDSLQNQLCVFAGGGNRQPESMSAQRNQHAAHLLVQIGGRHPLQETTVNRILFLCKRLLLRRRKSILSAAKHDVKTLHPAHAAQAVLRRLVKGNPQLVGQRSPGRKMVLVGMAEHAVQIKDDRLKMHRLFCNAPSPAFARRCSALWEIRGTNPHGQENGLLNPLKILRAVLAERADEIRRQLLALVDIAADLADPAGFLLGRSQRLGLDAVEVVGVGDRGRVG